MLWHDSRFREEIQMNNPTTLEDALHRASRYMKMEEDKKAFVESMYRCYNLETWVTKTTMIDLEDMDQEEMETPKIDPLRWARMINPTTSKEKIQTEDKPAVAKHMEQKDNNIENPDRLCNYHTEEDTPLKNAMDSKAIFSTSSMRKDWLSSGKIWRKQKKKKNPKKIPARGTKRSQN